MTTNIMESSDTSVFIFQQDQRKTSHRHGNGIAWIGNPVGTTSINPGAGKQRIIFPFKKLRIMVRRVQLLLPWVH